MTKKAPQVVIPEDEAAAAAEAQRASDAAEAAEAEAYEAKRASDEHNEILQKENADAALLRSQIRAEAAGVELNEHGVPMGIDLTFEETMRMQRALSALGTSAEHSEADDAPAPRRRRK